MRSVVLPEWLPADLAEFVRETVEPILPDQIERPVSPQAAITAVSRAAMHGYQLGRDAAVRELRTTAQVAAELGLDTSRVRALARARGVGWDVGSGQRLFRPEDVDALRERRPGRPSSNVIAATKTA